MAHQPAVMPVDANGVPIGTGGGTATVAVPAGAGTKVVSAAPGRLWRVVVTAAGTAGQTTFYDNASTGSGTVVAVVPGTATAGTTYDIQMPVTAGITAVGVTGAAGLTVSYS